MSAVERFALPDVGEGLTDAEVVRWLVAVGDEVADGDPVVEVETAKSVVELPCPFAGTVVELLVAEGASADVGAPLLAVRTGAGEGPAAGAGDDRADAVAPAPQGDHGAEVDDEGGEPAREAVLVGYGVREAVVLERRRRTLAPELRRGAEQPAAAAPAAPAAPARATATPAAPRERPPAAPPVRAMARDLGIDLREVSASGTGGAVTRDDVRAHAARPPARLGQPGQPGQPGDADGLEQQLVPVLPRETRVPVRGVRRATAEQMVASAFTAPHATAFTTVDVSRSMAMLERIRGERDFRDVHVSPLLLVARAVCLAAERHPGINASWDELAQEIVVKHYVNLGIAVATDRGLLVPSIKDADAMGLRDLAHALGTLVETTRAGRAAPADLSGSTITVTNIGVFGVDSGTPILNPGEAAILCVGAVRRRPWVHKGKVRPRWVVELSVSFDHRLVDGDLGSRFLADVARVLERPDTALRWA